jgi:hypothetical protein
LFSPRLAGTAPAQLERRRMRVPMIARFEFPL